MCTDCLRRFVRRVIAAFLPRLVAKIAARPPSARYTENGTVVVVAVVCLQRRKELATTRWDFSYFLDGSCRDPPVSNTAPRGQYVLDI